MNVLFRFKSILFRFFSLFLDFLNFFIKIRKYPQRFEFPQKMGNGDSQWGWGQGRGGKILNGDGGGSVSLPSRIPIVIPSRIWDPVIDRDC